MGYYIRVLSPSSASIPVDLLERRLKAEALEARFELGDGSREVWKSIDILHAAPNAPPESLITRITCDPVDLESLDAGEIAEFIEEVQTRKPESAARWLGEYLPR